MSRGNTGLDSHEYDEWLTANKKEQELRARHIERRNANKGYSGWHFGIDSKPVYTKDKDEFRRELSKRGLLLRDDVRKELR